MSWQKAAVQIALAVLAMIVFDQIKHGKCGCNNAAS